jgi:serine/threonine-protein kinase
MFMAPEQARGGFNTLDARSDVYALGILLYAILYGRPPFPSELSVPELLLRAGEGIGPPPRSLRPLPDELVELWREATALEPADRPADAGALASRVRAWQEGARRRDRAAGLVERAAGALDSADRCRAEAQAARSAALQRARAVQPWSPLSEKRAVWEAEDAATAAEVRAEIEEVTGVELLRAALTEDPTLPEARAALADRYQARHADAERRRDSTGAARWEALLRAVDDGRHAAWLKGEGRLSLVSQPRARVRALLYRLVVEDRRLVERFEADLGRGPLRAMTIPHGSWLIELHAPGYAPTRYPVFIERGGEWSGVPPGGGEVAPVPLVPEAELGRDGVYVPAGWAVVGGDSSWSASGSRQLVWIEGFICERHPVTNARFMAFLDALVASGAGEQADRFAPRWQTTAGETPASVYGLGSDGRHCLRPDADGDTWEPDWPVFLIERAAAEAFAAWEAARTGRPWRLPFELEWEKAARGVDGRTFPWGDTLDPAWACVRGGSRGRVLPAAITAHPEDESVYGVRGMGGNVQDWCQDAWSPGGPAVEEGRPVYRRAASGEVTVRGGAWNFPGDVASTAFRTGRMVGHRRESLGFRLFRSWPERSGAPEDPLRC